MNRKNLVRGALAALALAAVYYVVFARGGAGDGGAGGPGGRAGGFGGPGGPGGFGAPAVVRTAVVEQGEFDVRAEFVGTLQARTTADLFSKVQGQIVQIAAETGDTVRAGQLLARIDAADQRQRVEQAEAALRMAQATVGERRAGRDVARATDERTEALFKENLIAAQQRDTVRAERLSAEAQVRVAEAAVEQARANVGVARAELAKTEIRAPFSGVVGKRHLDLGAFATTSAPVFSLVDVSTIKTTIALTEKDAVRVRPGQRAVVSSEAFPGTEFAGRVARIASVFDPNTNTTEAEVEIDNPGYRLKPGMFANVAVTFRTEPTALLVPKAALVEDERETYLFIAERAVPRPEGPAEGRPPQGPSQGEPRGVQGGPPQQPAGPSWTARRVAVRRIGTGSAERHRDSVAVEGDLRAGQPVITLGQQDLRDGSPVRIAQEAEEETAAGAEGGPA